MSSSSSAEDVFFDAAESAESTPAEGDAKTAQNLFADAVNTSFTSASLQRQLSGTSEYVHGADVVHADILPRHERLKFLRCRIEKEAVVGDDDVQGGSLSSRMHRSSGLDQASLASWGRALLRTKALQEVDALDSASRKGSSSNEASQQSSKNASTENTVERSLSPSSLPHQKLGGSLDDIPPRADTMPPMLMGPRLARACSSAIIQNKSSSLPRNVEFSMADPVRDEILERKNSEIIESIVGAESMAPVPVVDVGCRLSSPDTTPRLLDARLPDLPEEGAPALDQSPRNNTPDIVASNTVKSAAEQFAPPLPPPRRRRSKDPLGSRQASTSTAPSTPTPTITVSKMDDPFEAQKVLDNTMLTNLDTSETFPLSRIVDGYPLNMHISEKDCLRQDEDTISTTSDATSISSFGTASMASTALSRQLWRSARHTTSRFKRDLSKKLHNTVKTTTTQLMNVKSHLDSADQEDQLSDDDFESCGNGEQRTIRIRAAHHHKGPYDFDQVKLAQEMKVTGPIWSMKFSDCGRLLAVAGQDTFIRVWVLKGFYRHFTNMRDKYSGSISDFRHISDQVLEHPSSPDDETVSIISEDSSEVLAPFLPTPIVVYKGHSADVLDVAWSKNYFLLSCSMDKTVRLWHLTRQEALCCFRHQDFVSSIAFLPRDDKFFLSTSLDGKIRLWHIPEKKVALWNDLSGNNKMVTAMTLIHDGKYAAVGTSDGRVIFYDTAQLKYHKTLYVKSSRGRNSRAHKITGLEGYKEKLLVTSNDSRIRLYDVRDFSLICKYKGFLNSGSQIRASFSPDHNYIVCGSENHCIYLWHTVSQLSVTGRKDRNKRWESIRAHSSAVTVAIFAPKPQIIMDQIGRGLDGPSSTDPNQLASTSPPCLTSETLGRTRGHENPGRPHDSLIRRSSLEYRTGSPSLSLSNLPTLFKSPRTASQNEEVLLSADFSGSVMLFLRKPMIVTGSSYFSPSYD